jgi:hypothetical protein
VTFIPATMATLFMKLLDDERGGWQKKLTDHLINMITKILMSPLNDHAIEHKLNINIFKFHAHSEKSIHISFQMFCHRFSKDVPSKSLVIQPSPRTHI